MGSTYPKEVYVSKKEVKGKKQTFSIVNALTWADDKPLTMNRLSRYVLTGIDISPAGAHTICVANIPADEVPAIVEEYREVLQLETIRPFLKAASAKDDGWPKKEENKSICMKLAGSPKMGNNKGKPYYTLTREDLISHRDFLAKNVSKYPKNQDEINVLNYLIGLDVQLYNMCVAFMKKREEEFGNDPESVVYTIYDSGLKPRMSSARSSDGKVNCYRLKLMYDPSMNYPFKIEIMNLWCPVDKGNKGTMKMMPQDFSDRATVTVVLSKKDGRMMFHSLENDLNAYRTVTYASQLRLANQYDQENRLAYKKAQAQQNNGDQYQEAQQYQEQYVSDQSYSSNEPYYPSQGFVYPN